MLRECSGVPAVMKRKLIHRELRRRANTGEQKRIHEKYCIFLVNYLHKINLQLIRQRIPPGLSVLETVDEGDYVPNDDGSKFVRKDYPHFSNTLKPTELPPARRTPPFLSQPQRIRPEELYFQAEDNCVLKVKHLSQFVGLLFKRSILFSKKYRMRAGLDENENHDFDLIADEMGIHFRTVKLLYDLLNEYFDLEGEMESYPEAYSKKEEENKAKAAREIKLSLADILQNHTPNQTLHIPHAELYISLR